MLKITRNTPGWLTALLLHGAVLLIPASFLAVQQIPWREVDFRVMEEPTPAPAPPQATPKPMPKPVLRDVPLKASPAPPVRTEEKTPPVPEKTWVEPTVTAREPTVAAVPSVSSGKPSGEAKTGGPGGVRGGTPGGEGAGGGADNFPHFLHRELPVYPLAARRMGREGRVVLRLNIDENGRLQQVEVVESSGFEFTRAAVEAVKKSTYRAALQNGRPVPSRAILPVQFILKEE
jgi:periplasmic protein TonB